MERRTLLAVIGLAAIGPLAKVDFAAPAAKEETVTLTISGMT